MPYPTPNLTTLQQQALSDIQSAAITDLSGNKVTGLLQKSVLRVLALVGAGFAYLHFKYIDYVAIQATPFTATGEWLAGWMALKGVTRKPPAAATGTVVFPALSTAGGIPIGTTLNRGDGAVFVTTAPSTYAASVTSVAVVAMVAGAASTIQPGDPVALGSPIQGITSGGAFLTALTPGADQETDAGLKTRGLQVYAAPPQGGAFNDYVEWAQQVPGVTRAWCPPSTAGAGTVQVYFMMDVTEAPFQGFPQGSNGVATLETRGTAATGDQLAVANYIYPLRPVTAEVYALAPTAAPQNFTLGVLVPNTPAIQSAITAALLGMFQQVGSPGGTTRPDGGPGGTIYESDWVGAIRSVPGVTAFDVTSPSGTITSSAGVLPSLGTISFPSS